MQTVVKIILVFFILFSVNLFSQDDKQIVVIGDSLVGKVVEGESVREIYGNVVLTQGDIIITCNKAIQYLAKNDAELIGDVVARQDSLTIKTPQGFYYGNEKISKSTSGVVLNDQKVILSADSGEYYFDEKRAFFQTNVKLYDTTTTLYADELTYFQDFDKIIAISNVKIIDKSNTIEADTLEHNRETGITIADSNVKISDPENNSTVYGNHLEDYDQRAYTLINEDPVFIQIDTTFTNSDSVTTFELDTLVIKSIVMEAFRDTLDYFVATDSVKIVRDEFASLNDLTIFDNSNDKMITYRRAEEYAQPVIWYSDSQLTGDSVTVYLKGSKIDKLTVDGNSFLLSQDENHRARFDQTKSNSTIMFFDDDGIYKSDFTGKVYTIYFMYEEENPNGLTKSNSQTATLIFDNNTASEVKLYGEPASEYYPENQVKGKEETYSLPGFKYNPNRPEKNDLLKTIDQKTKPQYPEIE